VVPNGSTCTSGPPISKRTPAAEERRQAEAVLLQHARVLALERLHVGCVVGLGLGFALLVLLLHLDVHGAVRADLHAHAARRTTARLHLLLQIAEERIVEEAGARHVDAEVAFEPLEQRLELLPHVVVDAAEERQPALDLRRALELRLAAVQLAITRLAIARPAVVGPAVATLATTARRQRRRPFELAHQPARAPLHLGIVLLRRRVAQRWQRRLTEFAQAPFRVDALAVAVAAQLSDQGCDLLARIGLRRGGGRSRFRAGRRRLRRRGVLGEQ
jgi:hypothetical protein